MATLFKTNLLHQGTDLETAFVQVCFYSVFATVTTVLSLVVPNTQIFFFHQSLDTLFINRENQELKHTFEYLVSLDDWFEFVRIYFIGKLANFVPIGNPKNATLLKVDENYMFGVPRVRQIRIKPEKCKKRKTLKTQFDLCYPIYTPSRESKDATFKNTKFVKRSELRTSPFLGNAATYVGPGYMRLLSFDVVENLSILYDIQHSGWIDESSRLIIIEFIIYNVDTLLLASVQLAAEILPTGTIIPHWEINIVPMTTIWSPHGVGSFIAIIVFYTLVIFYTSVEIHEMVQSGPKKYFKNGQTYIDVIILSAALIFLQFSIVSVFNFQFIAHEFAMHPGHIITLDNSHFVHMVQMGSMSICVFLVWAKVLRFIGFNRTMIQFNTTLRRCTKDILSFVVMFGIVFMGFSLCALVIFGKTNKDFKDFQNAFFSMFRMVLGDFQYSYLQYANRVIVPAFYLVYVLFITLILLNMFLAIINNTYSDVKLEITEDTNVLKDVFRKLYNKIKNFIKRLTKKKKQSNKGDLYDEDEIHSEFELATEASKMPTTPSKNPKSLKGTPRPSSVTELSKEDEINADLKRVLERIILLENLIEVMKENINKIAPRPPPIIETPRLEEELTEETKD